MLFGVLTVIVAGPVPDAFETDQPAGTPEIVHAKSGLQEIANVFDSPFATNDRVSGDTANVALAPA